MPDRVRVKICGLRRREDVLAADALGVDYVGVILSAGFSRSVEPASAGGLVGSVSATAVAVLVDEGPAEAAARAEALGAGVVQLHGREPVEAVRELGLRGPWRIWKSVRARAVDDVQRAVDAYGALVHGLLVEGWREGVAGGGGARPDPEVLAGVRERIPAGVELILAGGLTPDNVASAVARWSPDVVDVSSGVEAEPGRKDTARLLRFVSNARGRPTGGPPPPHPSRARR